MRGETFGTEYKPVDRKLLQRLFIFAKPFYPWIILALVLTILSAALSPLRPYLTKIAIDDYIPADNFDGLLTIILILFCAILLNGLVQFLTTYIMQWVGQKVLHRIRMSIFEHINRLSIKFFDNNPAGRLVTRITNDVEGLNQLFSQGVVMIFADVILILCIVGFMFYTNVELSLLTLTILPALLIVTSLFRKKVRVLFKDLRLELASMNSFLSENLSGISVIKVFSKEKQQLEGFDKINLKTRELNIKTIFYYAIFFPTIEMLSMIALGVVVWYAAGNVISGYITIGMLIAFMQYSDMFFRPVRDLTEKYTTLQSAMAAAERIDELLNNKDFEEVTESNNPQTDFSKSIEFRNLTFSYVADKEVLSDISFKINKGETVAIVGATGSGKTTLVNLLCRFYSFEKGEILIDGKDIRTISIDSIRKQIALVLQDVFLFSRSIKDNITLGANLKSDTIYNAIEESGGRSLIESLPNEIESLVAERGANLSAGQRQLIAFSRAFAANPAILILDEASSNIDTDTEILINKSLERLFAGRTSIVIAHRLSTIKRADKIIVLHKGRIKEMGKHDELLSLKGLYYKLHSLQFQSDSSITFGETD